MSAIRCSKLREITGFDLTGYNSRAAWRIARRRPFDSRQCTLRSFIQCRLTELILTAASRGQSVIEKKKKGIIEESN